MNTNVKNRQKMNTRDIFTVVLLALINVVLFFASALLYATPITIMLMPIFFSLLEGIVFFIIGSKVQKRGAIMIYCVVRGILGGYLPYVILYLLAGVIGELVMWKTHYGNAKGLTISYIIIQVFASIGSTIYPYAITFQSLAGKSVADGRAANITEAAEILQSGGAVVLLVGVVICAFIGARIGKKIAEKHLASMN